ncbi:MAG: alpha-isopropylmalate synthase regulatory domain-containing protein, partial [Gammaproteobacteria bacterium]
GALERATGIELELKNFEVQGVTMGDDAQGEVIVTVDYEGQSYRGHAVSTDIVESAALAYLEVINRILRRNKSPDDATDEQAAAG